MTPDTPAAGTVGLILLLTALTSAHVVAANIAWTLVLVPGSLLLAAGLLLLAAPVVARCTVSDRVRRLAGGRVAIASGLLLVGIAAQILIEHLV
jgi:putative Mn2+ efflux pump MntP